VADDGTVEGDGQSSYVLALAYDLLPPPLRPTAFAKLVERVEEHDRHLTTGFLATPHLLDVLVGGGRADLAYAVLEQDTFPSWGYQLAMGATTTWERWDGIKPDGSLNDPGMNSFNHYAFGAVTAFLFGTVAGIRPAAPGYRHVVVAPVPGGSLERAEAEHHSPRGVIASAWRRTGGDGVTLDVGVPPATTATVRVPGGPTVEVGPGRHSFEGTVVA
jgi:alpha-L-rhamnosidase